MKVKRIFAPDMRQAMRRVREEIGADAVIVSNHRVAGGVEVVAAQEQEYEAAQAEFKRDYEEKKRREEQVRLLTQPIQASTDETSGRSSELEEELYRSRIKIAEADRQLSSGQSFDTGGHKNLQIEDDEEDLKSILDSLRQRQKEAREADFIEKTANDFDDVPVSVTDERSVIDNMQEEIQQLKAMLEKQHQVNTELTSNTEMVTAGSHEKTVWVEEKPSSSVAVSGVAVKLTKRFERIGLGSALIQHLTRGIERDLELSKAWRSSLAKLTEAVPVISEDYIDRGGMIAFVGPTGVGKTTTIGKLAARYVLHHGSSSLALVTTDSYRIAAHEQLKTFGRILDVPVRVVDENNSLDDVLSSLRGKRLVLIDTAGMSQHEHASEAQKEMLTSVSMRIKKLLVLSCSSQRRVLEDACDNYQDIGLNGCVLSKADESGSLGEALTLSIERNLPIAYVTDGQKVPDDIEVAQRNDLVSRAVVTAQKALERERERAALSGGSEYSSAG